MAFLSRSQILALLCIISTLTGRTAAAADFQLSVTARVTDGKPGSTREFVFRVFSSETGGTALYIETPQVLPEANGLVHYALGSNPSGASPPLEKALSTTATPWLEVTVAGKTLPRLRLMGSPAAARAEHLGTEPASAYLLKKDAAGAGLTFEGSEGNVLAVSVDAAGPLVAGATGLNVKAGGINGTHVGPDELDQRHVTLPSYSDYATAKVINTTASFDLVPANGVTSSVPLSCQVIATADMWPKPASPPNSLFVIIRKVQSTSTEDDQTPVKTWFAPSTDPNLVVASRSTTMVAPAGTTTFGCRFTTITGYTDLYCRISVLCH